MSISTDTFRVGLDTAELDAETADLLPDRSALAFFNLSHVDFWQDSFAGSIGGFLPFNVSSTLGFVVVNQI